MQVKNFTKKRLTEHQVYLLSEMFTDRHVNASPEPERKGKSKAAWVYDTVTYLNEGDVIVVDKEADTMTFIMLTDTITKMFEQITIVQFSEDDKFETHQLWRTQLSKRK